MGMARFGLRNLGRSKIRLAVMALLIGGPFFLLLVMQQIGEGVQRQTELLRRTVDNTLQLRAQGSMGHVNMVGSSDVLPGRALDKVKAVEHVAKVEPYLLAMSPTEEGQVKVSAVLRGTFRLTFPYTGRVSLWLWETVGSRLASSRAGPG